MTKQIYILPDGPYEVSGDVPLRSQKTTLDTEGASVEWEETGRYDISDETYHLCRCGHSSKKPFCDGTHVRVNFRGVETAKHEYRDDDCQCYSGPELTLYDNEELCASIRFCDHGINTWNAVQQSDNEENRKLATAEVGKCPSGRLTLRDKQGQEIEPEAEQEICPVESTADGCRGPLWAKGGMEVIGANFQPYQVRSRIALCRCGESQNKPFCDSSHINCPHMKGFDTDF